MNHAEMAAVLHSDDGSWVSLNGLNLARLLRIEGC